MSYRTPRPCYQHHSGFYRSINPSDDFTKPWEASPFSGRSLPLSPMRPVFELPKRKTEAQKVPVSQIVEVVKVPEKLSLWRRILCFMKSDDGSKQPKRLSSVGSTPEPEPLPENLYSEKVPLHEWKQYGYWARPVINNVIVDNSPVTSEKTISTRALADLVTNMRGINDPAFDIFPERWIVGTKHRALPSRPTRWKDPDPNLPLPFPWEVQVNPLLHHILWGPPAMRWCVWDDPELIAFQGRTPMLVPIGEADRAQPATWPFLTAMHFNAVLGDDAYVFPWPFTVYNARGIKVVQILAEIYHCFRQHVTEPELASWPEYRQKAAKRTREERCQRYVEEGGSFQRDTLRRHDALGARMYFRGIEPTVDGGGWMIVFGTY